jgi:carotenoid cleavage dioxygenase-like enzyme
MRLVILILCFITHITGFFIKFPFGSKFSIKDKEVNVNIEYKLPSEKQNIVNKINGVYALIGPDTDFKTVSNLFDLFIGDGIIQSVFFDNGNLTYVKHYVRTEKIIYEEKNGKIPTKMGAQILFGILNKLGVFPNILGLANTAILNVKNKIYALYERDNPYMLNIDFENKEINTIKKISIPRMNYFSAHSKYSKTIDSIEYDVITNRVNYHDLDEDFITLKSKQIKMTYLPLVHDFLKTEDNIIIIDSPVVIDINNLFKKSMPVRLDNGKKTFIHVLNKQTMNVEKYLSTEGFYVFHYADYKETDKYIEIFASLYNTLDFSELNIIGKYRKIVINKETRKVEIIKNPELENLDLEFPVKIGDTIVLRNINNKRINGFVVCKELEILKTLDFGDKFICGEPAVHYVENIPYLFTFAFNENNNENYVIIINMITYETIEIPINDKLTIGFHSIFIEKLNDK